jgi:hypothetical protein
MYTIVTCKGTANFRTTAAAAEWLEELQPMTADVQSCGQRVALEDGAGFYEAGPSLRRAIRAAHETCRVDAIAARRVEVAPC